MDTLPAEPTDPRFDRLSQRLDRVERRLQALESRLELGPATEPADRHETASTSPAPPTASPEEAIDTIPLIGRTVMILGGAFVLRAVTEAGIVRPAVGAALGIAYALVWLIIADRVGRTSRASATFYGIAMSIIAFPLLWETTVQFGSLGPVSSATVLAGIAGAALAVCARRNLRRLAWITSLFAVASLLGLAVATRTLWPYLACLLLLGLVTVWLARFRGWTALAGFVALPACLSVLLATFVVMLGDPERTVSIATAQAVLGLQIALVLVYVGSFIVRTLATSQQLTVGEIVQGFGAATVGLGGAIALTRAGAVGGATLGGFGFLMGAACYAASFTLIDRTAARRTNFVFYTTLALVFTMVACGAVLRGPALPLALSAAAVFTAWIGGWRQRATLSLHGAMYLVAAGSLSGLIAGSVAALAVPGLRPEPWLTPVTLVTLAVALLCCAFPVAIHGRTWGKLSHGPRLVFLGVALLGVGGMITTILSRWLPDGGSGAIDAGALAVLRTGVLAVAAVALSWLGRSERFREAVWLVYPVLVLGGAKLLFEDFRVGRPVTLVASLVLYGAALIVAPRLARGRR